MESRSHHRAGARARRAVAAMRRSSRRALAALVLAAAAAGAAGGTAAADGPYHLDPERFGLASFTTESGDRRAGGHPDVTTSFEFNADTVGAHDMPYGRPRRIEVDMPVGLVGDPTSFPTCSVRRFLAFDPADGCRPESQVGVVSARAVELTLPEDVPVYNLERGPDDAVLLGLKVDLSLYAFIRVTVRPDGGLTAIVDEIPIGHPLLGTRLTLWGVPADHNGSGAPRVPFMTAPTDCSVVPTTRIRAYSYEGKVASAEHALDHTPEDCAAVPFEPTMTAQATERTAGAPTGLDVRIAVPQNDLPDGRASAHVDGVRLVLPEGMSVSPSSANGLGACAPGQFGYGTTSAVSCPDASKIGSVAIRSPLLEEPLTGSVFLARQNDNPFGTTLALYILAEGTGVRIKLAGRIDPDPVTGRLTTTFEDNPQLPFETFDLRFKSGSRAPLVNPQTCGEHVSQTRITSWSGRAVEASTTMTIDQGCAPVGFSPSFEAGMANPVGGSASTFSLAFGRGDMDQELRDIVVDMPAGLTGVIASADLCADGAAAAGACGESSRVGTVTTVAGPGSQPYQLPGRAYLTGPYKGAPLGLAFVVPAVAGPFDLGTVVVRAAVHVDKRSAALRVASDPLPRILQGIPLAIRTVHVAMDKPGFMLAPTSCAEKRIVGRVGSQAGAAADVSTRFQVGDCARLPLRPAMSLTAGARGRTRGGVTTPLTVRLRQTPGQGNLRVVDVTLPRTLNSRLAVVSNRNACTPEQFAAQRCPQSIGTAQAVTPLLRDPLRGSVYLVQNRSRKLPDMVVALKGQVDIDLVGRISIDSRQRVRTTFDTVPDVPISSFTLSLVAGRRGAVGIVGGLCTPRARRTPALLSFRAHNGKLVERSQALRVRGCGSSARAGGRGRARAQARGRSRGRGRARARRNASRGGRS